MRKLFCTHAGTLDLLAGLAVVLLVGYTLKMLGVSTPVAVGICMFPGVFFLFYSAPPLFARINRKLVGIGDQLEMHAKIEKGGFKTLQGTVLNKGMQTVPALYAEEYVNAEEATDFCVVLDTEEGQKTVPFRYLVRLL